MKILIAPDKFKGSLSATKVAQAIEKGIKKYDTSIETVLLPLADGGDGSLEIMATYLPFSTIKVRVQDSIGRPIDAEYRRYKNTAYIEMAQASGLVLLKKEEQNPLHTSTYGTGQMIHHAIEQGCKKIILFIGGSATNDAGMGMAVALGYQFLDAEGQVLKPNGQNLIRIKKIESDKTCFDKKSIECITVCDVQNPLYGNNGAAHIYAAQKGATKTAIFQLDAGLKNIAEVIKKDLNKMVESVPGSGAAGGMGAGTMAFLSAHLKKGTDMIFEWTDFDRKLQNVDLVISGEGKMDKQTLEGKLIAGIAQRAKKHEIPLWVIVGISELSNQDKKDLHLEKLAIILSDEMSLKDAMENAAYYIETLVFEMFKN